MSFLSPVYLLLLAVSALAYGTIVPGRYRVLFLFFCSLVFISASAAFYALFLIAAGLAVFYIGRSLSLETDRRRKLPAFLAVLFLLVGSLCAYKVFQRSVYQGSVWTSWAQEFVLPLGISFTIFRLIHYLVECYRHAMPPSSPVGFLHYLVFFPTFPAGPLERFGSFWGQAHAGTAVSLAGVQAGLYRMVRGVVKKAFVADVLRTFVVPVFQSPDEYPRWVLVGAMYGAAIQVYADFSGYTDMAIGSARLFGYKISENFNAPFLKKNIALFWRSWHITLYSWLRDYFFLPLFGYRASRIKMEIGIVATLVASMMWHRFSMSFFLLGVYHGSGLLAWSFFQDIKRKHPFLLRVTQAPWLGPFAVFLTFTFVSFGMILFQVEFEQFVVIARRMFSASPAAGSGPLSW
ncbi:MAG: hypothetical protein PHH75_00100 [Candidatus Omnitrophica bacterium]|nr:hypothetical protein [Candidatus Omnitrophota bacterium]